MHKWLLLLCSFCLLVGCRATTVMPQAEQFVCSFAVHGKENVFSGSLKREGVGTLSLQMHTPDSLNGLQVAITREQMTVALGELQLTDTALSETALPRLLCDVLDTLFYAVSDKTTSNGDVLQGRVGEMAYRLQVEETTGFLKSVYFPKENLECIFTDVQSLV